jgi:hypothetical protein
MSQIPRGPDHLYCPHWRKKMSAVCHTCPWWVQLRGSHPGTGKEIDEWNCAVAFGPALMINVAKEARQGAAATESFRNGLIKRIDPAGYAVEADEAPKRLT